MYHTSSALFVFLYCYRDRRDLHSFPTRRSSDLRWRVDEDLEEWTRKGQVFDRVRVELEGEIRFAVGCHAERSRGIPFARAMGIPRLAALARDDTAGALPVVRAQRGIDQIHVQPQNPVFIGIRHFVERVFDLR